MDAPGPACDGRPGAPPDLPGGGASPLLTAQGVTLRAALLVPAVVCAVACAATGARALPLCEEELSQAEEIAVERPAPDTLPIIPCAMVESGVLGPACGDATFYVVTDAGVMLCTVDIDTFQLTSAPSRSVETAPAAPAASWTGGLSAFATLPADAVLAPCVARDLLVGGLEHLAVPLERSMRPPVPPS